MFLDPLKRGWSLLFWASKIIKIEWLTRKLWCQTYSKAKSSTRIHNVSFSLKYRFLIIFWRKSIEIQWKPNTGNGKWAAAEKKKTLWIRAMLFSTLHVWHHNFFVSHSILMILDAQKSRDRPLSNGSKNINFRREKVFLRTRWKKIYISLWNTV